jgi:hypothetical protein
MLVLGADTPRPQTFRCESPEMFCEEGIPPKTVELHRVSCRIIRNAVGRVR